MKKIYNLICILFIYSCTVSTDTGYINSKEVIISGRIINADSLQKEILFSVYRPGWSTKSIRGRLDSLGNFSVSFELLTPTDISVIYKADFTMLIHPGDSIFMSFDGNQNDQIDVLKSIKYSGDDAKLNQDIAAFQQMYYLSKKLQDQKANENAFKEYDAQGFLKYLDTLRLESRILLEEFAQNVAPEEESLLWSSFFLKQRLLSALTNYPDYHRYLNNLDRKDWDVPASYFDSLLTLLPINKTIFICGGSLSAYINDYHYCYARLNTFSDPQYKECVSENIHSPILHEIKDSLTISGVIKYTPDSLLRQLVLAELLHQNFDMNNLKIYENNKNIIESYIVEPYLIGPLIEHYSIIKNRLENPKGFTDSVYRRAKESSMTQILDSVLIKNVGKVIYIDFWATWCSPCFSEFPSLKSLIKRKGNEEVAFVLLCVDSKEKVWKEKIDELKINGQHFYLTENQSNDIKDIFEFTGVPYFVLIDREGTIVEKGNHISPDYVIEEIDLLLK